ncbi:MAG: carboxypeptidase regulatory-like domain-containing protein [Candidatus Acidiferrales bacterium]
MTCSKDSTRLAICLSVFATLALSLLVPAPGWTQVAGSTLSGAVRDSSGAAIPQAQVSIKNVATGVVTAIVSNANGLYSAPNLLPGSYQMSASAPGFAMEVQTGITLTVGGQQVLDFTLQVGQVVQKVEVTGAAPLMQLASSTVGSVVDSNTVVELPLNGRDWTSLAVLTPGVNVVADQFAVAGNSGNSGRASRGFGSAMTISGTRPQENAYRLDGISVVDYADSGPGSAVGQTLGVDAVQEFSVLTSNYDAEYGRTSGGVINATTRSGTNQYHGDAYGFYRDEALDSKGFFDKSRLPFHRDQYGGSVGGPIQKGKTFFFVNYEGLGQDLENTFVNIVPSQDARNGIIHNANGTTTDITVNPLVAPFLGFYPLPNAGLIAPGNTGNFDVAAPLIEHENFVTTRIDRKFSDKDSVSGTYLYNHATNSRPQDGLDNVTVGGITGQVMTALQESHTFSPSLVNVVRVGYNRVEAEDNVSLAALNPLAADTSLGTFPNRTAPQITVTGLAAFNGGLEGLGPVDYIWNSYQIYDDAFKTVGNHSLKFGFAFERMQTHEVVPGRINGSFAFSSLTNFLTNIPQNFQASVQSATTPRNVRQSLFGGYLQDDWRVRRNLTINLGIRYEPVTVPTEIDSKLANLPTYTSPYSALHLGSPYYQNPTLRNFEPRVGFAWDPFHNGKTVVRGAFGIFDVLPLAPEDLVAVSQSAPFAQVITKSASQLPAGSFPTQAASFTGTIPPTALTVASTEHNPPANYMQIWNLNIQRELTGSTTLTIGYVGNHGVHMLNLADEADVVLPTQTPQGLLWPSPAGTRINPGIGTIQALYWGGDSEYHALTAQLTKRMSHGLQVQGSYTWGRSIDTGSGVTKTSQYSNSITSLFWFCKTCRRGLSDFNIAQTLVVNYIWDVPTVESWGTIASRVLGGWQLGGIVTAETGLPVTPLISGDPLGEQGSKPYDFPNRLTGPGCGSAVNPGNVSNYINLNCFALPSVPASLAAECLPASFSGAATPPPSGQVYCANLLGNVKRNSVIGPGLATWDFSLFKNNYIPRISESFNLQFRAEVFNILNRANFATPTDNMTLFNNKGASVAGAGALDTLSTTQREIQFGLKLIW